MKFLKLVWVAIKNRIIAGIITIIPIAITYLVVKFLFEKIHRIFEPVVINVFHIQSSIVGIGLSLFLAFAFVYIVGLLSAMLVVRRWLAKAEAILARIPLIKFLYLTSKQVIDSLAMPQRKAFKRVVLIEYPRKGIHSLAFATGEIRVTRSNELLVSLFLPTTPNPTSGYLLYLPKDQIQDTNLTIEEGMKIIISGGILSPTALETNDYDAARSIISEPATSPRPEATRSP
jgi:uncharacterized membrane protein